MSERPCSKMPEMWFDEEREAIAKARCSSCPFKAECLQRALDFEEKEKYLWGVWGGASPTERLQLLGRDR